MLWIYDATGRPIRPLSEHEERDLAEGLMLSPYVDGALVDGEPYGLVGVVCVGRERRESCWAAA